MTWRDKYLNQIVCGDCLELMPELPDGVIDLTVTSPPYGELREYDGYTFDFAALAVELCRVTKLGGVVVWVAGDETRDGDESGESFRQALYFKQIGFKLHDTMIFEKHNFANPSHNRYHQIFEYMFIFSKGRLNTFNPIKDKKINWTGRCWGRNTFRVKDGSLEERDRAVYAEVGKRTNIWRIANQYGYSTQDEIAYKHPAIFPEALARDHILTWSNAGDVVLDPIMPEAV